MGMENTGGSISLFTLASGLVVPAHHGRTATKKAGTHGDMINYKARLDSARPGIAMVSKMI
jgi:hypothetical protein